MRHIDRSRTGSRQCFVPCWICSADKFHSIATGCQAAMTRAGLQTHLTTEAPRSNHVLWRDHAKQWMQTDWAVLRCGCEQSDGYDKELGSKKSAHPSFSYGCIVPFKLSCCRSSLQTRRCNKCQVIAVMSVASVQVAHNTHTIGDLSNDIHPIFRSTNFTNVSEQQYEVIKPSLRLATRLLTTDCLLDFAYSIFAGDERSVYNKNTGTYSHVAYFRPKDPLTHADYAAVKQ